MCNRDYEAVPRQFHFCRHLSALHLDCRLNATVLTAETQLIKICTEYRAECDADTQIIRAVHRSNSAAQEEIH